MRDQRVAVALPIINILVLVFLLSQFPTTAQESVVPIIRARAIELVDENGKKRAQLNVEENGEIVFACAIVTAPYEQNSVPMKPVRG